AAGVGTIRRIVEIAPKQGIGTLTLYAFSTDNWRRPKAEVAALMTLLRFYLANEVQSLVKNGVRLTVIGRRDRLPNGIANAIARAEDATTHGRTLHLRIAVDYSARDAILNAAAKAAALTSLTREAFSQLVTGEAGLRDVDLIIRTSGEKRLSDFLLWEGAYAELHFTERMWPEFDSADRALLSPVMGAFGDALSSGLLHRRNGAADRSRHAHRHRGRHHRPSLCADARQARGAQGRDGGGRCHRAGRGAR